MNKVSVTTIVDSSKYLASLCTYNADFDADFFAQ